MYEDLTPVTQAAFHARRGKGEKDFRNSYFSDVILTGDLRGIDFTGSRFMSCKFSFADVSGAKFTGATINADFLTTVAAETNYENACIYMGLVKESDFHGANFGAAILRRVRFHKTNLSNTDFTSATLDGTAFSDLTVADNVLGVDTMRITMGGATTAEVENLRRQVFEALHRERTGLKAAKAVSDRLDAAHQEAAARAAQRQLQRRAHTNEER